MEKAIVGKYFALIDECGVPHGRAIITEHIYGPFYLMDCFGFVDEPDCQSIFTLENSEGMPLFPSLDILENYIAGMSKVVSLEGTEVSH